MILSHKIRLDPTKIQAEYFRKACGTARFVYNWGLANWKEQYEHGEKPSANSLKKQFNSIKRQDFPWITDVTKCAPETAFQNLGDAFQKFFTKQNGYPTFKKRGKCRESFGIANDKFTLREKGIKIPKLGWVKMKESLRFQGKIVKATVSRIAGRWFVSVSVKMKTSPYASCKNQATVGVDVGIKTLATLSTGETFENPKALRFYTRRLKRLQRQLSKKKKGSQNRKKAAMRVAKLHYRIACIRRDATQKLTTYLTQNFKMISIEDLNVAGMLKNHKLAKAVADANFSEIFRQLGYKKVLRENELCQVERFFASSKTCSDCAEKHPELTLADRVFVCPSCGMVKDRDLNAAVNIDNRGRFLRIDACGLNGSVSRVYRLATS